MAAEVIILAFIFIIGLCIGSFLNVVILRALSNESIVFPASKCPNCQNPLKWWHNIPLISYIGLKGKCAFCKEHISIQYPIIELLTGIMFTLMFIKYDFSLQMLFTWIVSALFIVIAGTDIKEKVVFDVHTYSLIGIGLLFAGFNTILNFVQTYSSTGSLEFTFPIILNSPLIQAILGALVGALVMEIFARAGYLIAGTRAFGEGDTYIAAGLGALFGWKYVLLVLALSGIIQVILFLPIFVKGMIKNKEFKTLGAFCAFVIYATIFYGLQHFGFISSEKFLVYTIGSLILAVIGASVCILIFKDLREHPENRTYLPFGPAMIIAGFIAILL